MSWSKSQAVSKDEEADEEYKPLTFSPEEAEEWFKKQAEEPLRASSVCCVSYGWDGTGKSGLAIDSRSEEQIANEMKNVSMDIDQSASELHKLHKYDPNLIFLDPWQLLPNGQTDYVSTYNRILSGMKFLLDHEEELNLAAVNFDGLDTFLKLCEYVMRYEDLAIDPDAQIKDQWQWSRRNRRYLTVIYMVKRLKCDRFFTTHFKEVKQYVGAGKSKTLTTTGRIPDWEKTTPGVMFQRVLCERNDQNKFGVKNDQHTGAVELTARIEKSKGALHLEGRNYTLARVDPKKPDEAAWFGLKEYLNEIRA